MADKLISKIPDGPLAENGPKGSQKFVLSVLTTKGNLKSL